MLCCSLATNELSVILLFVTFPVVSVFARSLILGVTVRTQHGFFFLTLSHTPLSDSFIILFFSVCLCLCNFVILQGWSGREAGEIMSFLFVFQHNSNHINISIFHQVLAVHKPFFSVQGTLYFVWNCLLFLVLKWANKMDIGLWEAEFETLRHWLPHIPS